MLCIVLGLPRDRSDPSSLDLVFETWSLKLSEALERPCVAVATVVPAWSPALFAAGRWGVTHSAIQAALGGGGKFCSGWLAGRYVAHVHEHPHEPPTLLVISFTRIGAVAFEIDVVHKGVNAVRGGGHFIVVRLNSRTMGGRGGFHDFG